ncbi:hypothetical protein Q9R19_11595 [Microbacterium sp. ARD32]|uniref:hypothetical protein n=1 Tax=Microbacterium sp. ARD32 TaxID=2962577 RepID=UPI002880F0DA|nr:hypothetical protein [Microbacterium sp. ARD32]MDT0158271.1 hypothetical protein [Microbacterium sp. ARD32]
MILTDDHGAQAIGAYGSVVNATPHIDAIAESGWRFDSWGWRSRLPRARSPRTWGAARPGDRRRA